MDNSNRADSLTVIDDSCFPARIRADTDLNNANVRVDRHLWEMQEETSTTASCRQEEVWFRGETRVLVSLIAHANEFRLDGHPAIELLYRH